MRRAAYRDDEGSVAVIVAVVLVVVIGFAALVIDMGYMYSVRRQLQSAADAAALAGCQRLMRGATAGEALAVAQTYAEGDGSLPYNAVQPADGDVMIQEPPYTEVGEDYVQVTVAKHVGAWFGRVLGSEGETITAVSRAKVAYVTGGKGLVPWGVPVLRATHISVSLGGGPEVELEQSDETTTAWEGDVSVPTTDAGSLDLAVIAYNDQDEYPDGTPSGYPDGFPEVIENAAAISVIPSGFPIVEAYLDRPAVTAEGPSSIVTQPVTFYARVAPSAGVPDASIGNVTAKMTAVTGDPGLYSFSIPLTKISGITSFYERFPVSVSVGSGQAKQSLSPACVLLVRRSTFTLKGVSVSPALFQAGEAATAHIRVDLNEFVYGEKYTLKVVGGEGDVGNFCALDLTQIKHASEDPHYWRMQDPSEYDLGMSGPTAYDYYLAHAFPNVVHIGDVIWTQTGNGSGPQTETDLETRFAGDDTWFADWEKERLPSKRVLFVPVMEKIASVEGNCALRIVALAAFYVEPDADPSKFDITGRFIEYVQPGDSITDEKPESGYYIETSHLVPVDY